LVSFDSVCHASSKIVGEHGNIYPIVGRNLDWVHLPGVVHTFGVLV